MIPKIPLVSGSLYRLRKLSRRLWVRASLVAGLGLIAPLIVQLVSPFVPERIAEAISADAVENLLEIVASSMLAVTIFSLSVMLSARQSASSQATPRSQQLFMEDTTSQTVQATFLGAFVFSLISLISLSTGYTSSRGAAVMLGITLWVIGLVVLAILRWIDHLSNLGSVSHTITRVEQAAREALNATARWPNLGANPLWDRDEIPPGAIAVRSKQAGYLRHLDMKTLSELAETHDFKGYIVARPGAFVACGAPLMYLTTPCGTADPRDAFTIGENRVFDQDPRFGIIVLSEIAQRALSPGVNDPGTAIDVLGRLVRLLGDDPDTPTPDPSPEYPRLWLPPVTPEALMRDGFDPIARDGAATVEVHIRLQKALAQLARSQDPAMARAARACADRAMQRARGALTLPDDLARLEAVHSAASA